MSDLQILLGAGGLLVGLGAAVITAVLSRLAADEVSAWAPVWARGLLAASIKRLPVAQMDRYREEWNAELATYAGHPVAGILFALRLRRRAASVCKAILEEEELGRFPEPNPFPGMKPLTPEVIAEIVRRVVERTKPDDVRSARQIIDSIRTSLEDLKVDDQYRLIMARYLRNVDPAWPGLLHQKKRAEAKAEDFGFDTDALAHELDRMLRWVARERQRRYEG
jgi:hypothetical protein